MNQESSSQAREAAVAKPSKNNRRTISFVVLFVVYVMAMLTGYRYAINSEANMWYLFQVASDTSWILDLIGDESQVEPYQFSSSKRAELNTWRNGGNPPSESTAESDDSKLTPLENWMYRAYTIVNRGKSLQNEGPLVRFTLAKGIRFQQQAVREKLNELERDKSLDPGEKKNQKSALKDELARLKEEDEKLASGKEGRVQRDGKVFSFRLVPDCGAIPSMSIFIAAVLAFPALWWKRLTGVLMGMPILYGVNLARISSLGYLGAYEGREQKWFDFAHHYVWQGIFIIFVVALWMAWIEFMVRKERA